MLSELPERQEASFFGRQRELWDIERFFVEGIRWISITGLSGQGKTYLAQEAGRWLRRTGMFDWVSFIPYEKFQGIDAVGYALATFNALKERQVDEKAVTETLRKVPTLIILDNVEALAPGPLVELLAVAEGWSKCGDSRILITSQTPQLPKNKKHRAIMLRGLGAEDALDYFQSLMMLPPAPQHSPPDRESLLRLFRMVAFHPLSVHLLAARLKRRKITELGERLEFLFDEVYDDKNPSHRASIQPSLDSLDANSRKWLPCLSVFLGGAMEKMLLCITEIPEAQWPIVRRATANSRTH